MLMNEEITSWFNTEVFAGIESVMHNAGYDVSLFQHVDTAENRRDFFTNLPVRRNVDAVFVTSFGVDRRNPAAQAHPRTDYWHQYADAKRLRRHHLHRR